MFACPICQFRSASRNGLLSHVRQKHAIPAKPVAVPCGRGEDRLRTTAMGVLTGSRFSGNVVVLEGSDAKNGQPRRDVVESGKPGQDTVAAGDGADGASRLKRMAIKGARPAKAVCVKRMPPSPAWKSAQCLKTAGRSDAGVLSVHNVRRSHSSTKKTIVEVPDNGKATLRGGHRPGDAVLPSLVCWVPSRSCSRVQPGEDPKPGRNGLPSVERSTSPVKSVQESQDSISGPIRAEDASTRAGRVLELVGNGGDGGPRTFFVPETLMNQVEFEAEDEANISLYSTEGDLGLVEGQTLHVEEQTPGLISIRCRDPTSSVSCSKLRIVPISNLHSIGMSYLLRAERSFQVTLTAHKVQSTSKAVTEDWKSSHKVPEPAVVTSSLVSPARLSQTDRCLRAYISDHTYSQLSASLVT